jgi:acetyl esterase/lipase
MRRILFPFSITLLTLFSSCSVTKTKDISYLNASERTKLNVFSPTKVSEKKPVLIYVHGGYWNSGNKDIYGSFGRNFAKKNVVTVIPNYTLSPNASYKEMTTEIAAVIKWTKDNIKDFNGDPDRIFVTGHSAGGHLVALATLDPSYGVKKNMVKGIILNDAAGLDMFNYLQEYPPTEKYNYDTTWTLDPNNWKDASPIYFLSEDSPSFLIYVGTKTYESIISSNKRFVTELQKFQTDVSPIYLKKKHIPMITHYFLPWSDRYDEIIEFMNE